MIQFLFTALQVQACAPGQTPAVRREWRELSDQERADYVNAVVCLHGKPSKLASIQSPSRFDDVAFTHFNARSFAHGNSAFLPWHRAYLQAFETF